MKNIVTVIIVSLFIASPAFSQEKRGMDNKIEKMSEKLDLSDEQKVELKEHFATIRGQRTEGQRPSKEERAELKQKHQNEMKRILTDEQFAKLESMASERKMGKGKRGGKGHGKKPNLNLSDDQKAQVKELRERNKAEATRLKESLKPEMEQFRSEMKSIREKYSGSEDKEAMKSEMKSLKSKYESTFERSKEFKEDYKKEFESILTQEQLATLEASKGEKRMHRKKRRPKK